MASAAQGEVQILQHVHTAEQGEGTVIGEGDVAELNLTLLSSQTIAARRSLPALFCGVMSDSLQP